MAEKKNLTSGAVVAAFFALWAGNAPGLTCAGFHDVPQM
jgi:hypothetical protein